MSTTTTDLAQRVRALAEIRTDEPVLISAYVNLDPSEFPTAKQRVAEFESLADRGREIVADLELSHGAFQAVSGDLDRVRRWAKSELDPEGIHGVAVFCCSQSDVFDVFRLSTDVEPEIHIDKEAHLEPLTAALPTATWCVFLVNRQVDRILRGTIDRLVEVGNAFDEVHGQHDQGGWSQARYQRSVEKEVSDHVHAACDRLFGSFRRVPFDKLLLGVSAELRPEVTSKLHPYLMERLVTDFEPEVEHEDPDEILERVRALIEADERREEAALIERLAEQLGRGERAVSGMDDVLKAIDERRVDTLFIDPARRHDELFDVAVHDAVRQAATVREIRYREPERALGAPIAALLRF